ncbi:phage tail protein [Chromobacterium piscinae]|uniref:phage tail protein n=1 Tax=Chromobacterium piscinae TaxID=686831 RepID=UPI003261244C
MNTLQELAAALGNDQNFAATVTNKLANKADKSSSLAGYGINTLALSTAQTAQIIKTTPNIYDNNLYTSGTLELRSTGTDFPSLGLHRPGNSAVALVHKGYGNDTLMLKEASGGEYRVWHSGNDASFIKRRRYRVSVDDKTSLDDAIAACETGFNYGTSSGVTGPFIAFGGLGEANSNLNYPCQLTADYTTGYVMRFRTRNDDAQRWNPWYSLIHEGYLTGQVAFFAMANPPQGWLQARGNAVSRTVYAALFAAIGTTYGAGDGSTTFNLPDLRGEFVRGWDANVDQGRVFGSKQKGTLVVTNEYFNDGELYNISTNVGLGHAMDGTTAFGADVPNLAEYPGLELHSVTGNRATLDNYVSSIGVARPHNIALLACIKY